MSMGGGVMRWGELASGHRRSPVAVRQGVPFLNTRASGLSQKAQGVLLFQIQQDRLSSPLETQARQHSEWRLHQMQS
jgi:hypothetical protein